MKTFEYVPTLAKGDTPTFEGSVLLKTPSFDDRFRFVEECGFETTVEGVIDSSQKQIKPMRTMVKISEEFYKKVSLKKLSDGTVYKSFDDLSFDPECTMILIEIASTLMGGKSLSKN